MSVNLEEYFNHYKQKLDENLIHAIEELPAPKSLKDAMKYSLKAGGKRIRPLLLFASIKLVAREFVHFCYLPPFMHMGKTQKWGWRQHVP